MPVFQTSTDLLDVLQTFSDRTAISMQIDNGRSQKATSDQLFF